MTRRDGAPHIGGRLREARVRRGLTLAQVAEATELTKGFLSTVERDLTSPSVGTLVRICSVLELSVGELFGDAGPGPLVRAAERAPLGFGGDGVAEYQLTPAGEARLLVLLSDIAPGATSGDEVYRLAPGAVFVHVLLGELRIEVAGASHRLAAGDSLTFDAAGSRRWGNPSGVLPARVLWALGPAPR